MGTEFAWEEEENILEIAGGDRLQNNLNIADATECDT